VLWPLDIIVLLILGFFFLQDGPKKTTVTGVEMFKKLLDQGQVRLQVKHYLQFRPESLLCSSY
jgi:hypothetical protein